MRSVEFYGCILVFLGLREHQEVNLMKKVLSVLLAIAMLFSLTAFAFAEENAAGDPIIYVYGFGRCTLTRDIGTENETAVFMPDQKIVAKTVTKLAAPYAEFKLKGDYHKFALAVCDAANYMFDGARCDENGDSIYNVAPIEQNIVSAEQEYGKLNYFYYDWRLDITLVADQLNDYINAVLEATGKKKVALVCESMGGCVGTSYLVKYGHDKCSSIIMDSVATYGVRLFDEILLGNFKLNPGAVYDYLRAFGFIRRNEIVNKTLANFGALGGFDALLEDVGVTVENCKDDFYENFIYPTLATIPGLWAFVSDENFAECKSKAGIVEGTPLADKINNYHYNVKPYADSVLKEALDDGVKLAILSGYGFTCTPVISDLSFQSDFLIGTKEASYGATCAKFGETFDSSYVQKIDDGHNHISGDRVIDASTCKFPENTWLIKNAIHTMLDDNFLCWVAYTDGEVNITANENFPQFLEWIKPVYVPLTDRVNDTSIPSWYTKLLTVFIKLIRKVLPLLTGPIFKTA